MYSRILVAIDESAGARHAVDHAAGLAKGLSASLRILHVLDLGWLPLEAELGVHVLAIADARRAGGEKLLASARERVRAAGIEAETRLVETSGPVERIATAIGTEAAEWRAGVVVLATQGRRGVERLVLGSVAEDVARRSAVPVLLVPWPEGGS
jgi:nucleotide-binding universal stress UspA family protein